VRWRGTLRIVLSLRIRIQSVCLPSSSSANPAIVSRVGLVPSYTLSWPIHGISAWGRNLVNVDGSLICADKYLLRGVIVCAGWWYLIRVAWHSALRLSQVLRVETSLCSCSCLASFFAYRCFTIIIQSKTRSCSSTTEGRGDCTSYIFYSSASVLLLLGKHLFRNRCSRILSLIYLIFNDPCLVRAWDLHIYAIILVTDSCNWLRVLLMLSPR